MDCATAAPLTIARTAAATMVLEIRMRGFPICNALHLSRRIWRLDHRTENSRARRMGRRAICKPLVLVSFLYALAGDGVVVPPRDGCNPQQPAAGSGYFSGGNTTF